MGYFLTTDDVNCDKCKGKCWDSSSNANTQTAALKMFGSIPNKCVNGENGVVHCPYAAK